MVHRTLVSSAVSVASKLWSTGAAGVSQRRRPLLTTSAYYNFVRQLPSAVRNTWGSAGFSSAPAIDSREGDANGGGVEDERRCSAQTLVRHQPAPGWVYPPVPDGCSPKFAVIKLGNTQYKASKPGEGFGMIWGDCRPGLSRLWSICYGHVTAILLPSFGGCA